MKKISKAKLLIISVYLICLLFYILMLHITNINISKWDNMLKKVGLEQPIDMDSFTFLHIHICYFILTTYYTLKYLNVPTINKIPEIIIFIIAFSFLSIGVFKYYRVKYYSTMIAATGLSLGIITIICRRISNT